jgi:hypothetical protein
MCVVCLALNGLRPRERTASDGRRSAVVDRFAPRRKFPEESGTMAPAAARGPRERRGGRRRGEATALPREGRREKAPVILRAWLGPRAGGRVAAGSFLRARKASKVKGLIDKTLA